MVSLPNIDVRSPATGRVVGAIQPTTPADLAALTDVARTAQRQWHLIGFQARRKQLYELRGWIVDQRARIIEMMQDEGGKTYEDALLEVLSVCNTIRFWARHAEKYLREQRMWAREPLLIGRRLVTRYEPHGVIAVIAPWNYPLVLGIGDALPALMAGNAVILKPSEVTPLASTFIIEEGTAAVGMTPGVFQVANGAGDVGAALVDHADMVMFTGSTATGRKVAARAADRLIPVTLELGGKDPMIVLADANLERAANFAVYAGLTNSGQTCQAVERIYVEAPVYEKFVDLLVTKVSALRQGAPGAPGSIDVGSLTGPGQFDKVAAQLDEATRAGARIVSGGDRSPAHNRFAPTVLTGVDHSMSVMRDETFGPILPVMKVRDAEEAIKLANDSGFGLNSSVFTRDLTHGEAIARRIAAGSSCVNDACSNFLEPRAPFGGWKDSGLGSRNGPEGIRKYCRQQTVLITRFGPDRELYMFPYRKLTSRIIERFMVWAFGKRRPRSAAR